MEPLTQAEIQEILDLRQELRSLRKRTKKVHKRLRHLEAIANKAGCEHGLLNVLPNCHTRKYTNWNKVVHFLYLEKDYLTLKELYAKIISVPEIIHLTPEGNNDHIMRDNNGNNSFLASLSILQGGYQCPIIKRE